jgi:hypothetical protein
MSNLYPTSKVLPAQLFRPFPTACSTHIATTCAQVSKFNFEEFYEAELEKKHKDKSYRYFNNINRLVKEFLCAHMSNKDLCDGVVFQ